MTRQQLGIYFLVGIMVFSAIGTGILLLSQGDGTSQQDISSLDQSNKTDETQQICEVSPEVANQPGNPEGEWPITSEPVTELVVTDLRVGIGDVAEISSCITVHYRLSLSDGTPVEGNDTFEFGQPATFPLTGVIVGWQEGISGMREGGLRRLIVPPQLAYEENERPGIPPNSTLIFDVELVKVEF